MNGTPRQSTVITFEYSEFLSIDVRVCYKFTNSELISYHTLLTPQVRTGLDTNYFIIT